MTDFFIWLQKLSQQEYKDQIEIFVDEDGEVEFEIDQDIFIEIMEEYKDQIEE